MNAVTPPPDGWLVGLRQRWEALAARERQGLAAAAAVVVLALVWLVAVQPAWRTLAAAPATLAELGALRQAMQADADDARALRAMPPLPREVALEALQAATERLGEGARLTLQGDRAALVLKDVDGDALRQWLGEIRGGARARVLEAQLRRGAAGYSGQATVALGGVGP